MKKVLIILINLFLLTIPLNSCTNYYHYDFEKLNDSVKHIYIVEVQRNEYYGEISIDYLMEVEEDVDNFINELESLDFRSSILLSPENNTGVNIMLVCDSEEYDYVIVGLNGIEEFKNNKQTYLYNALCNTDAFDEILNKYYK